LQNEVLSCKTIYAHANTNIMQLEQNNKKLIEEYKTLQKEKTKIEDENRKIKDLVRF